ncbi:MAG: c-type cytochrome [Candidatus Eisenbacteria bacterium]|nr:c-type cytochrome [Candidatus Eisenbacteria bacterium]
MSLLTTKYVLTLALFGCGVIALWTMLTLMGRNERSIEPAALRVLHRVFGYIALALAVVVGIIGYQLTAAAGGAITHRAVLHCALAALFFVVFLFKVAIARHYRQFLKHMPALGLIAFAMLFAVVSITAGHRMARDIWTAPSGSQDEPVRETPSGPDALSLADSGEPEAGRQLFVTHCGGCHAHDSTDALVGPGLKGLVAHETEEEGSRERAFEAIRSQILNPAGTMPAFEGVLAEAELGDLLAYLGTL